MTGLFLSGNNTLFSATGFEAISNTLIRFTPPFANLTTGSGILVVQSPDGQGTSEASGGAITIIPTIGISRRELYKFISLWDIGYYSSGDYRRARSYLKYSGRIGRHFHYY